MDLHYKPLALTHPVSSSWLHCTSKKEASYKLMTQKVLLTCFTCLFFFCLFVFLQPLHKSVDTENFEQLVTPLTTLGHLAMLAPEQFAGPLKSLVANFIVKDLLMNDRVSQEPITLYFWFCFLMPCSLMAVHSFAFTMGCWVHFHWFSRTYIVW